MAPPNKATPKPGAAKRPTQQQQDHEAIAKLTKDNERLKKIYRANFRLGKFQDLVLARAESWRIAALNIGSAYAVAAKRHTDAMAKQDKIDALKTQWIFSVLTVATSGALSWVTSGLALAETFPERKVLVDALLSAGQAGMGETFSAMGPAVAPVIFTQKNQSVNIDPQVFQNEREKAVSEAKIKILERFAQLKDAYADIPLEKWDDYTEAKQLADHNAWLKQADTLAGKDDLPSIDDMADELERGIWKKWMPGLKGHRYVVTRFSANSVDDYTSCGAE